MVRDYAELFKSREEGQAVQTRIIDRHFAAVRNLHNGLTLKQEFGEVGIDFQDSYHVAENVAEVETGILKIKEYLKYDRSKPLDSINQPLVTIDPKCKNTILACERWARDPKTYKPKEEWKDFVDVQRYLVMSEPEIESHVEMGGHRMPHFGVNT